MNKVSYFKPFITFEEQAQLLIDRGLIIHKESGKQSLIETFRTLNFFRFNGYCNRYYNDESKSHEFYPGTTFKRIWNDYVGDMRLRGVLMEAIQEIEISLRSQMANVLGSEHGIYPYKSEYYGCTDYAWNEMYINHILKAISNSKEASITNFLERYSNPVPPIWMTIELLSFGEISALYSRYLNKYDKKAIAVVYGLPSIILTTWFHSLSVLRNRCAHHAKILDTNSTTGIKIPKVLTSDSRYGTFIREASPYSLYANIIALCYLEESLKQNEKSIGMIAKLKKELNDCDIEESRLGFPDNISLDMIEEMLKKK